MDKEDARYQKLEQLHERCKQVVRLHRKGQGVMAIVGMTGLSYPAVRLAIDLYEEGGYAALKPTPRGPVSREGRTLTAEQEAAIHRTICDKRPEQLKMEFALWNRAAVMQLIEDEYGIKLSVRGVGNYLLRWGAHRKSRSRKPTSNARRLCKRGSMRNTPRSRSAPRRKVVRFGGGETALVNTDVRGRSYAPAGQTPVTYTVGGTRQKLSMIATVTNQSKTRWMIIDEAFNSDKLIEFLEALIKDAGNKIF